MAPLGLTSDAGRLSPDQIAGLFAAVDSKLEPRAKPVEVLVVGGAAIALLWNPSRLTRDVDVVTDRVPDEVWRAAAEVAAETEGLAPSWFNAAALVARPTGPIPDEPTIVYSGTNLVVSVAGPRFLLAMKVFSGRPEADADDLPVLFDAARITSIDDLHDLYREAYPGVPLHQTAERLMEQAWNDYAANRAPQEE